VEYFATCLTVLLWRRIALWNCVLCPSLFNPPTYGRETLGGGEGGDEVDGCGLKSGDQPTPDSEKDLVIKSYPGTQCPGYFFTSNPHTILSNFLH